MLQSCMFLHDFRTKNLRKALIFWFVFWLFNILVVSIAVVNGWFNTFSNWLNIWLTNTIHLNKDLSKYLSHSFLPTIIIGYIPSIIFLIYLHKKFFTYLPKKLKKFTTLLIPKSRNIHSLVVFGIMVLILPFPVITMSYPVSLNTWGIITLSAIKFSVVGLVEELMYRGWLFVLLYIFIHKLTKNKTWRTTLLVIIVTNLIFSISHIPTFLFSLINNKSNNVLFVPQFVTGVFYSILMLVKPNLLLLSLAHMADDWYSSLGIYLKNCTISIWHANYCTDIAPTSINIMLIAFYWKDIKKFFVRAMHSLKHSLKI